MKKLLGILLALALLLGCTAAFADPITLTYAEVNPVPATLEENAEKGSVVSDVAWAFKTKLEELSAGEIVVDLQGGGVLGSEKEVLANILGGDTSALKPKKLVSPGPAWPMVKKAIVTSSPRLTSRPSKT